MKLSCCLTSSLQKNIGCIDKLKKIGSEKLTALKGERLSFQWVISIDGGVFNEAIITVCSPLREYIKLYTVENVPVNCTCYPDSDSDFISKEPGIFPDLLLPVNGNIVLIAGQVKSIWAEISIPNCINAGIVPVKFEAKHIFTDELKCSSEISVEIIDALLPEQTLKYTQWIHYDCLSDYYGAEVLSEKHWTLIGNYISDMVESGVNMLLVPVFTPPLDTEAGGERPTVQLVDISVKNNEYSFDFAPLKRLISIAKEKKIKYFEISHMFSQWGADFTPKIKATADGVYKNIFFWNRVDDEIKYRDFLSVFIPALKKELQALGILEKTFFHISDEPGIQNLNNYRRDKEMLGSLLCDCSIIDAVSDCEFYENGLTPNPIVANNQALKFFDKGYRVDWIYYCCGQQTNCSNRFISMPSYRNRIIGVQMFKYNISGFLHWGYNFWYNYLSRKLINPFCCTDADGTFPGGDPFSVYPGIDFKPLPSIRQKVFYEALQDMRALELLAGLTSREYALSIIDELSEEPVTFVSYPKSEDYIMELRERINREIKNLI